MRLTHFFQRVLLYEVEMTAPVLVGQLIEQLVDSA